MVFPAYFFTFIPIITFISYYFSDDLKILMQKLNFTKTVTSSSASSNKNEVFTNLNSIRYTASASSFFNKDNLYIYYSQNACDGNKTIARIEEANSSGNGEWINLNFNGKYEIDGISIINGWANSQPNYFNESRVARIFIEEKILA